MPRSRPRFDAPMSNIGDLNPSVLKGFDALDAGGRCKRCGHVAHEGLACRYADSEGACSCDATPQWAKRRPGYPEGFYEKPKPEPKPKREVVIFTTARVIDFEE